MAGVIRKLVQEPLKSARDALSDVLKLGATKMLAEAVNAEVQAYIEAASQEHDETGHRLVVRNGYHQPRTIQTGLGDIDVKAPRVNDRRVEGDGNRMKFSSSILPPYLRRTKSIEELIPWLYLKGISTGDFQEALGALLGADADGLSATTITRKGKILSMMWDI